MKLRSRMMLCLLSSFSAQAYSQDSGDQGVGSIAETESQFLFINMLEFLGEFETEAGEWISPDIIGNDIFTDLDNNNIGAGDSVENVPRDQRVFSAGADEE